MSKWITITVEDLYDYLAAEQVAALQSEALGSGQSDPLPTLIADVTEYIRAEIRGNSGNDVDSAEGAIPPELRSAAIALIVEAAQARLPALELSDDQVRLANAARALLKRVASGDVAIEAATADGSSGVVTASGTAVLVKSRSRFLSSSSLESM